jgi:hypothetical protein
MTQRLPRSPQLREPFQADRRALRSRHRCVGRYSRVPETFNGGAGPGALVVPRAYSWGREATRTARAARLTSSGWRFLQDTGTEHRVRSGRGPARWCTGGAHLFPPLSVAVPHSLLHHSALPNNSELPQ